MNKVIVLKDGAAVSHAVAPNHKSIVETWGLAGSFSLPHQFQRDGKTYTLNAVELVKPALNDNQTYGASTEALVGDVWTITTTVLDKPDDQIASELSDTQDRAIASIDGLAEQERQKYLTAGSGQAMVYQEKAAEAIAYFKAAAAVDPENPETDIVEADYPHLLGEVGITADDLLGVATLVKAKSDQWITISVEIEKKRKAANKSVSEAGTKAAIDAILAGLDWTLPA